MEEEKSYGVQAEEDEEKSWMEAGGSFYYFGARGVVTRNEQARSARGWQDASSDARRFHRAALKAIRTTEYLPASMRMPYQKRL